MAASVELVLFAIQAGVRLGTEARRAYMDDTRNRELTLPLPNVNLEATPVTAMTWFAGDGAVHLDVVPGLRALHDELSTTGGTEEQRLEFMAIYQQLRQVEALERGVEVRGELVDAESITALLRFQQYQKGDPNAPRTLQRVAGTIVELAVDYFVSVPGALSEGTSQNRVVRGVLDALDDIEFSELSLDEDGARQLAGRLLISALETISNEPQLLGGDANVQELVKVATGGLARDISKGLDDIGDDLARRERLEAWGDLVFRSLGGLGAGRRPRRPGPRGHLLSAPARPDRDALPGVLQGLPHGARREGAEGRRVDDGEAR